MATLSSRKGALFTITIFIVGLLALSFSLVILRGQSTTQSDITLVDALFVAREDVVFAQSVIRNLSESSGVFFSSNGTTFEINETLPNPSASSFSSSVQNFVTFASDLSIETSSVQNEYILISQNYNLSYGHLSFGSQDAYLNISDDIAAVSVIVIVQENVSGCTFSFDSGSLPFDLSVMGTSGSSCTQSVTTDPSGSLLFSSNSNALNITIDNYQVLFTHALNDPVDFHISGTLNQVIAPIDVWLKDSNISSQVLSSVVNSPVRLR